MKMAILFLLGVLVLLPLIKGNSTNVDKEDRIENSQPTISKHFPPFGRAMRQEFLFSPDYVSLNHGSYGKYPKSVRKALHEFQDRSETNSELWIRRELRLELDAVRTELAELISAAAEDIVMIPNATSGMNAIFRSMIFQSGDGILFFSTTYDGMHGLINYISDSNNGTVTPIRFTLNYPVSNEEFLKDFEKFLDETQSSGQRIRIALVDHISSVPGVVMPVALISHMLKQRNILVLVDGAHAIGQIHVNITQLAPDYYITDCHKWLYTPRGSALMYVDKRHQATIHPAHISSNYAQPSRFQDEFFWTGTMDYSPYMTVPAALDFRRQVGGEAAIRDYNRDLAVNGGKYLARRFETEVLQDADQIANMVDVRLPIDIPENKQLTYHFWVDTLLNNYTVYAAAHKHNGQWWLRVSAQIYNDMNDFKTAADTFIEICNKINYKNYTQVKLTL